MLMKPGVLRETALAAWPILAAGMVFPWWGTHRFHKIALILIICAWAAAHWYRKGKEFSFGGRALPFALSLLTLSLFMGMGMLAVVNHSNYDWGDIAYYLSSFHNSKGWLPGSNVISGRPFLAHHSEFYCIPLGWIFRLAPGHFTLQLVQAACITAAWALFRSWILGKTREKSAAEWLAFGFALSPCLLTLLLKGFHGVAFAAPFLVLTAASFHDRNWRKFLISLILLLLVKEVFTITAISLGCLALLQRRPAKWIVAPIALGLCCGIFLRFAFFPMMLKDSVYYYSSFVDGWRPMLARILSVNSIKYGYLLLLWGGTYAVLRSPYLLLALPPIAINLALNGAFASPSFHYIMEPSFWIFFAGATSFLEREAREADEPVLRHRRLASFLACMLLMNFITRQGLPLYRHHEYEASFRKALEEIPEAATLSLGVSLEDHLWKVKSWYWIHYAGEHWLPYDEDTGCRGGQYALLPRITGPIKHLGHVERERIRVCLESLEKDPAYVIAGSDKVLTLFRRKD